MFPKRKPLVTAKSSGHQQERALVTAPGQCPGVVLSQRLKGGSPKDPLPLPHPEGVGWLL